MHDEFDPHLVEAFARVREPPADDVFTANLLLRLGRARRARLRRQILIIAAVVIMVSLNLRPVLEMSAAAVRLVGDLSPLSTDWLMTPWG